jgi:predicted transcriptional regulator of viral defense system
MELHRMVVQPQLVTTVSVQRKRPPTIIGGYEIRFVVERPEKFFGLRDVWVGDRAYKASDLERTVVDGLRRPSFVGGITEVGRGMSMRADKIDPRRVVEYLLRMNVGAAIRRGGFLLEELEIGNADDLAPLRDRLTATYETLDPTMPKDGGYDARWRLLLNVSREEIQAVRST